MKPFSSCSSKSTVAETSSIIMAASVIVVPPITIPPLFTVTMTPTSSSFTRCVIVTVPTVGSSAAIVLVGVVIAMLSTFNVKAVASASEEVGEISFSC